MWAFFDGVLLFCYADSPRIHNDTHQHDPSSFCSGKPHSVIPPSLHPPSCTFLKSYQFERGTFKIAGFQHCEPLPSTLLPCSVISTRFVYSLLYNACVGDGFALCIFRDMFESSIWIDLGLVLWREWGGSLDVSSCL